MQAVKNAWKFSILISSMNNLSAGPQSGEGTLLCSTLLAVRSVKHQKGGEVQIVWKIENCSQNMGFSFQGFHRDIIKRPVPEVEGKDCSKHLMYFKELRLL